MFINVIIYIITKENNIIYKYIILKKKSILERSLPMRKITIKCTKNIEEYITIRPNETHTTTLYSYTKESNTIHLHKSLYNKDAFIQYLKAIQIANKFIKEVESYE